VKEYKHRQVNHNFLLNQYKETGVYPINHNYLFEQFCDYKEIFEKIENLITNSDYTLGKSVDEFERNICSLTGSRFAIGVGSGTDALLLSLIAAGIKKGDEVITTPYTFYATIGAIVTAGAKPVFVDIRADYNINTDFIEKAITDRTKAILPVHWSGLSCKMERIMSIAENNELIVIEDACHGINANYKGKPLGTFGLTGCFSMHPLKNLNVWGDGGYIITDSEKMHEKLVLMRNHGLTNRDECSIFTYNSRLDSIQAIVANHLLEKIDHITNSRINTATEYDQQLSKIPQITIPDRSKNVKQVYHIYVIRAERRDELKKYLNQNGIDAKVHYPIPMHLQPAAKQYGYKRGDFPVCEMVCDTVISLPVHEFITNEQIDYVVSNISDFYAHS
jgi:dTDP-4-amino-4,6-dideoxygalactose transaminase